MTNRRGFLGIFGAGAMIAPIIGGVPDTDKRALIVTPPTVEIPEPPKVKVFNKIPAFGESKVVVFVQNPDKSVFRMDCKAFAMNWTREIADVTSLVNSDYRQSIPVMTTIEFKVTGEVRTVDL